mgnify:CR=1 FL=1
MLTKLMQKYVIIVGDDELARGEAIIRDMESSEQETVAFYGCIGTSNFTSERMTRMETCKDCTAHMVAVLSAKNK